MIKTRRADRGRCDVPFLPSLKPNWRNTASYTEGTTVRSAVQRQTPNGCTHPHTHAQTHTIVVFCCVVRVVSECAVRKLPSPSLSLCVSLLIIPSGRCRSGGSAVSHSDCRLSGCVFIPLAGRPADM